MNLTSILLFVICLLTQLLYSQNLFPNPDFEQYSACPTTYNHLSQLQDWQVGNQATPDYYNCSFSGSFIQGTPSQGSGVIGMWGGANHASCSGSGYAENIIANLTQTILPNKLYLLSFDLQIDTGTPNDCMRIGVYFFNSQNAPVLTGLCAPTVNPQFSVAGSNIQQGSYTHFEFFFSPDDAYDQVLISPFTSSTTSSAVCSSYSSNRMYVNLDNLSLTEQLILPLRFQKLAANSDGSNIQLIWEIEQNHTLDFLEIQRSEMNNLETQDFVPVGYLPAQYCEEIRYTWLDSPPKSGSWIYRIKAVDHQGDIYFSQPVSASTNWAHTDLYMFPNPSQGQFTAQIASADPQQAAYVIYDVMGREVCRRSIFLKKGSNELFFHLPDLPTGRYVFHIQTNDGVAHRKPLIIR